MKKIIKATSTVSKLDIINAEASKSFKSLPADGVTIKGVALVEDINNEGEVGQFAYIFTPDGIVYGGNSATIYRACEGLIDLMNEDEGTEYHAIVNKTPTNGGREFLTLTFTTA